MTLQPNDLSQHPVGNVQWVPIDRVRANGWNPNSVAANEMRLLSHSIRQDGFTQPVVTMHDPTTDTYVVVDGFHRYTCMKRFQDIRDSTGGLLPVVVIDKNPEEAMASTVRHNRARGKHSVGGMSTLVFSMLEQGMTDEEVCNELGMEAEELIRLKHITGFAKLFDSVEYRRAWVTRRQIKLAREYNLAHPEEAPAGATP
jgi:ParB-like chromosome segregation protein Spo0J